MTCWREFVNVLISKHKDQDLSTIPIVAILIMTSTSNTTSVAYTPQIGISTVI